MSYPIDYIDNSLNLIKNDISLFGENVVKLFEITVKSREDYSTVQNTVTQNENSLKVLTGNESELIANVKYGLKSAETEVLYKHGKEIKIFYFGNLRPSEIAEDLDNSVIFCSQLLKNEEERAKNELKDSKDKVEKTITEVENHLKALSTLNSKAKSDLNLLLQADIVLHEKFEILKNAIKNESIGNKNINFRLYFPVVKSPKTKELITIVDETDFDLFVKLSDIPSDLKTNKIYLEWYEELKRLFYKKKNSEYQSFLLADEFIIKKYKK